MLLAVDVGLRTGLAYYNYRGKLEWYRSKQFGNSNQLRRAIFGLLEEHTEIEYLVIEGSGKYANPWQRAAAKRDLICTTISAETWRKQLLYPREQRSGSDAKRKAMQLALDVIIWSGAPKPTSLKHDAAEAILVGLWGVLDARLLPELPPSLKR